MTSVSKISVTFSTTKKDKQKNFLNMEQAVEIFLNNELATATLMQELNVQIPTVNINQALAKNGTNRFDLEKLLQAIPITSAEINISDVWEAEEDIVRGLMAGRYIKKLKITGCGYPIETIPPSTEDLIIEALAGWENHAIMMIARADNLRSLTLINGTVDTRTWEAIGERTTKIHLNFINTRFTDVQSMSKWMPKFASINFKNAFFRGVKYNRYEINAEIAKI